MKIVQTGRFKKDVKRLQKRGKQLEKMAALVKLLVSNGEPPEKYRDHGLTGNWVGWRDLHIEPDWILIYRLSEDALTLARTGSHSDLF